jgi:hypothetical protein
MEMNGWEIPIVCEPEEEVSIGESEESGCITKRWLISQSV